MSNFRDLQKLRNTKNLQILGNRGSKQFHYEGGNNYLDTFKEPQPIPIGHQYNKYLQSKELAPMTTQKQVHRRNGSNGTTFYAKRQSNYSPGLSIYNLSMKLTDRKSNPLTSRKEQTPNIFHTHGLEKVEEHKQKQFKHRNDVLSKNMFKILYPIGKGGFGKVWKVQMKRTRELFAMKQMFKAKIIKKKSINSVMNQRKLLGRIQHPFIVNMTYAFQDRDNLYLFMDYLNGGDLRYHIGRHRIFNQKETKFFIANIIIGLEYLHTNKIIHRDIKPENLVLDYQGYVRITDLGVSRKIRLENSQDTSGTPGYMAPEIICRKNHGYQADFFAVGVIGYQFMLGRRPYNGQSRKEIKQQILSKQAAIRLDQLPYKWSPAAIDLINKLLIRNPERRLGYNGINEIKQHPWFIDMDWKRLLQKQLKAPFIPLSIEQDYDEYKQQISEDTLMDDCDETKLMLRQQEIQTLFEGYLFNSSQKKTITSSTTHPTQQNFRRI